MFILIFTIQYSLWRFVKPPTIAGDLLADFYCAWGHTHEMPIRRNRQCASIIVAHLMSILVNRRSDITRHARIFKNFVSENSSVSSDITSGKSSHVSVLLAVIWVFQCYALASGPICFSFSRGWVFSLATLTYHIPDNLPLFKKTGKLIASC